MEQLFYTEEAYQIIGICMDVHRIMGKGHSEVVYKDALKYKFQNADITPLLELFPTKNWNKNNDCVVE